MKIMSIRIVIMAKPQWKTPDGRWQSLKLALQSTTFQMI